MQKTEFQIISQNESRKLTQFLCKEGRLLLPIGLLFITTRGPLIFRLYVIIQIAPHPEDS